MAKCLWGEEEVRKAERGTRNREGLFFGGPTKEGSGLWTGGPFQGRSSDGSRFWFVTGEDFTRLGRVLLRPSLSKHVTWLGPGSVVLLAGKHIQGVTWRDGWNQSLPDGVEAVSMKGSELSAAEAHPAAKVSEDEGEGEEEEEGEEQEGGGGGWRWCRGLWWTTRGGWWGGCFRRQWWGDSSRRQNSQNSQDSNAGCFRWDARERSHQLSSRRHQLSSRRRRRRL